MELSSGCALRIECSSSSRAGHCDDVERADPEAPLNILINSDSAPGHAVGRRPHRWVGHCCVEPSMARLAEAVAPRIRSR